MNRKAFTLKDKSKKGFWTRIKNIYDNSPGHAAFTYPIAYIILAPILGGVILGIFVNNFILEIAAGIIMLSTFLAPIWVLTGLIVSKKKLPYILSLIVGFGLLCFIFYMSLMILPGDHGSAQSKASLAIHSRTVKYIAAEIKKCDLGDDKFMGTSQDCPATTLKAINGAVATTDDKNPYYNAELAVRISNNYLNDKDAGFVNLDISGSNIIITTCYRTPCKKEENRQQSTVSLEDEELPANYDHSPLPKEIIEDTESIINADSADDVELNCKYKATDKTVNLIIDRKNKSVKYDGRNYRILYILGDNIYFRSEHNYSDVVYNYSTNNLKGAFGLSLDEIKKNMNINTYNPVFANCYIKK